MFNKKAQRIVVGVIALLISFSLVGVYLLSIFDNGQAGNTGDPIAMMEGQVGAIESYAQQNASSSEAWEQLATTCYELGNYYQQMGDTAKQGNYYTKAAEAFEKSLALQPKNPASRVDMAVSYFYSNQLDKAEQNFKQAIAEFPTYSMARSNYSIFLWQARKDTNGAVAQLQEILKNNPTKEEADRTNGLIAMIQAQTQGGGAAAGGNGGAAGNGQVDWSQAAPAK